MQHINVCVFVCVSLINTDYREADTEVMAETHPLDYFCQKLKC